ncbi:hypothetical protein BC831DRAFT_494320 [Entophlyctis helioformis]|nr:hypothetical protein BC831DRAFT_494320 [Entophlyctis helioformis]
MGAAASVQDNSAKMATGSRQRHEGKRLVPAAAGDSMDDGKHSIDTADSDGTPVNSRPSTHSDMPSLDSGEDMPASLEAATAESTAATPDAGAEDSAEQKSPCIMPSMAAMDDAEHDGPETVQVNPERVPGQAQPRLQRPSSGQDTQTVLARDTCEDQKPLQLFVTTMASVEVFETPDAEMASSTSGIGSSDDDEARSKCFLENARLEAALSESNSRIHELERQVADLLAATAPSKNTALGSSKRAFPLSSGSSISASGLVVTATPKHVVVPSHSVDQQPRRQPELERPPMLVPQPPPQGRNSGRPPLYPGGIAPTAHISLPAPAPPPSALRPASPLLPADPSPRTRIEFLESLLDQTTAKLKDAKAVYERRCERLRAVLSRQKTESAVRIYELESEIQGIGR